MVAPEAQSTIDAPPALAGWRAAARDLAQMLRFHSRLPIPALPFEVDPYAAPDFRIAPRLLPLAGAVIALPAAVALLLLGGLGLPPLVVGGIAIAGLALVTGGLHEDGLADCFDGLAGGTTRERRLEIMKDSRIGSHGATALGLALLLRVCALAGVLSALGSAGAALALVAGAAVSRAFMLAPLVWLPPARPDGAAASVGRPDVATVGIATALALVLAVVLSIFAGAGPGAALAGAITGASVVAAMMYWAFRAIGGHTGDVAGACQQVAEIGFLVGALVVLSGGKA